MAAQRGTTHKFEMTTLVKCFFKGLNTLSNIESGRLKQKIRLVNLSQGWEFNTKINWIPNVLSKFDYCLDICQEAGEALFENLIWCDIFIYTKIYWNVFYLLF
jgi:hypothetical protein